MRKESVGRLLLTVLTVFIMVVGVFGAAINTLNTESLNPGLDMAARELDKGTSGAGDTPASADMATVNHASATGSVIGGEIPSSPEGVVLDIGGEKLEATSSKIKDNPDGSPEATGTRAATLDANGPYGTMANPFFEGSTVTFDATLNDPDPSLTYTYRWDIQNDGEFETAWQSDPEYIHYFEDNHIGEALVQAWDGTWTVTTYYGDAWGRDEQDINVGFYCHPNYNAVFGWQFNVNFDVTVYELGAYRGEYWNYPYPQTPHHYEYAALYTTGGTLLAMTGELWPADDSWAWETIPEVTLFGGNSYIVCYKAIAASRTYPDYYSPGDYATSLELDDDGALEYVGYRYYYYGGFPRYGPYSSYAPMVDLGYYYEEVVPNVIEDTADVWVDNVAPIPLGAAATPDVGIEGTPVTFTGSLYDASPADSWEYRWDFGDGTVSDWMPVRKIGGTARILLLHSWVFSSYGQSIVDSITENLGGFIEVMDLWDFGPVGLEGVPELSDLLNYDVVLISMDYYIYDTGITNGLGDVLADFSDLGGGVVQCTFASGSGYYSQVAGRWMAQGYNPLQYAANHYGYVDMGTVYDSGHMIMNGVNEMSAYYKHGTYGVTAGATLLADYVGGYKLCAYTNEDHHLPGGGRVVGLNTFVWPSYVTGDGMKMVANSIMWASNQAYYLSMPIPLDPVEHTYKDDHPEHITPSDDIIAKLEIRDDDDGKVVPLGGLQEILPKQKFDGSFPPAGWTVVNNNPPNEPWRPNTYYGRTNYAGGDGPCADADSDYAIYYGGYDIDSELWTPSIDLSTFPSATVSFVTSYNYLGGSEKAEVDVSTDGGASWTNILSWTSDHSAYGPGEAVTLDLSAFAGGNVIVRFHYDAAGGWMWWWEVDDIVVEGFESYIMDGLGVSPDVAITIRNAMPIALSPEGFDFIREESSVVEFEGFELYDKAMNELTETFWYRVDMDDGTPVGPWMPAHEGKGIMYEDFEASPSSWPWAPWEHTSTPLFQSVNADAAHDGSQGLEIDQGYGDMWTYREDLSVGNPGEVWGVWLRPPATGYSSRAYLGFGADSGGCYAFVVGFNTGTIFFYDCDPYGSFTMVGGDTTFPFVHDGWYYAEVEFISTTDVIGRLFDSDGTTLIAEIATSNAAGWNTPGGLAFRMFDYGGYPRHCYIDTYGSFARDPIFPTIEHAFMDNGIYYVDYQIIDDDMNWDFSGGYPVYVGPAGEENDWISHTIFPIEIDNTDPVISPRIKAYGEIDLSLRMSGEKKNSASIILEENGEIIGMETVLRDPGAPDIVVLSATIQMTKGYEYNLKVVYNPEDGDGANPTWIFEGHFPDGKIKELRHTFNSNDPSDTVWEIGNAKSLLLGHDIIFEAEATDKGSDDLAFVWNFGDSTPHGIHIFTNLDPSTAADGVSDEASLLFNQVAGDPWFDRPLNTMRSPFGSSIAVQDTISHVFDENQPYYYYVTLTVMDDDVGDGYPSPYLNGGGYDMEFCEIDFR